MAWILSRRAGLCGLAALVLAALQMPNTMAHAGPGAAERLVGSWAGSGRLYYTDGSSEGISCNAYYTGGGSELTMAIQCRSERNPIHVRSKLRVSGGHLSGAWEERTFNAAGTAEGSMGSNAINLQVSGGGFSGSMAVSVSGSSHSVNITTQGIAMSRAVISFRKR